MHRLPRRLRRGIAATLVIALHASILAPLSKPARAASLSVPPSLQAALSDIVPNPGIPDLPAALDPLAQTLAAVQPPEIEPGTDVPRPGDVVVPPLPERSVPHPADGVDPRRGEMPWTATDLALPARGPDLMFTRTYAGPDMVEDGMLGPGWRFAFDQRLRMYVDFDIVHYTGDGGWNTYRFVPNDPEAYVESYDGDELIYYNLDEGHWQPDYAQNLAQLVRLGPEHYEVRHPDGLVLVFRGYFAPWRENQHAAGRLLELRDPDGNVTRFEYDDQGRLVRITDAAGRAITLAYGDSAHPNHLTALTDPLGRTWRYTYDERGRLRRVI